MADVDSGDDGLSVGTDTTTKTLYDTTNGSVTWQSKTPYNTVTLEDTGEPPVQTVPSIWDSLLSHLPTVPGLPKLPDFGDAFSTLERDVFVVLGLTVAALALWYLGPFLKKELPK